MAPRLYSVTVAVTFALLAVVVILWSMMVLRWSVARRTSPWRRRVVAVSIVAGVLAAVSAIDDLWSIALAAHGADSGVAITITDMDTWWQLAYRRGSQAFLSANEVHVPIRSRVTIDWKGSNVVLWRAHDFLPQEVGRFVFVADRDDDIQVFRLWPPSRRHLRIVADRNFDRWFEAEAQPARWDPAASALFMSAGCSYCHVIRGINDKPWKLAPELTHFASRQTIAAIDLPNRRGDLAGWIVHSSAIKRSSQMPENNVRAPVLNALLKDLESLR